MCVEQLENALVTRTNVVKSAVDRAIPKANYQNIYHLKTPDIRDLGNQYKTLIEFATCSGWTLQTYRKYQRIRTEVQERWKEAYGKSWEDKISLISVNSKI